MTALLRLLWNIEADAQGLICAFTPDERMLIAGAEDGSIYAFDRSGRQLWRQQISGEAFRFAFSRHSNILAIGTIRGADTSVLNFETGELLWKFSTLVSAPRIVPMARILLCRENAKRNASPEICCRQSCRPLRSKA